MFKKMIITTLFLGLFTGNLQAIGNTSAPKNEYSKASKPKLVLSAKDIALIEKVMNKNFYAGRKLTGDEKQSLKDFLNDYIGSVKHEIKPIKPGSNKQKKGQIRN